jgi:hypothetical protein
MHAVFTMYFGLQKLGRETSWLEGKRWYVATAISEGGVGAMLGVVEQVDVWRLPRKFEVLRALISCQAVNEVACWSSTSCWRNSIASWLASSTLELVDLLP